MHGDFSAEPQPIAFVREGMTVLDSAGIEVGTVRMVKMADPQAVTSQGQTQPADRGLWGAAERAFGEAEPDVPAPVAERLLRTGYIKVDANGLMARDLYVPAEDISTVHNGMVRIRAGRDELIEES